MNAMWNDVHVNKKTLEKFANKMVINAVLCINFSNSMKQIMHCVRAFVQQGEFAEDVRRAANLEYNINKFSKPMRKVS